MTPAEWSRIQQGIFKGESGGDYGALFGYQNRPNGRFSDVNLTNMTVDQALDFASPSGAYGQYVKGQVGHVATPMGAYQIVGTTLRDAKKAMGLTGSEVLTPEMQDQIGQWIYKTQGTGAWEGYTPMTDAQAIGAETMQALGKQPQGILAPTPKSETESKPMMQEEQQPRGLLGSLGIQKMEEGAEGETGQRFYERDTFKDTAAALAQGFAAMGSSPALQKMTADIAGQRSEAKARNKTVEYLRANGRGDLADMIAQGMISGKDAAGVMLAKPEGSRTALIQNYEYFIAQGMTPEQAMAAVKTGNTTNINTGGDSKFEASFAASDADTLAAVSDAGMEAMRNLGRIDELDRLLQAAPSGAEGYLKGVAGQYGVNTEGLSEIQAATALINSLVPEQRQPGSGPMSDADLELFKQSLPRIINQPGGNSQIISTMRAIANYDAQGAEVVQRLRAGEIDRPAAFQLLQNRSNPLSAFKPPAANSPAPSPVDDINSVLGGE